LFKKYFHLPTLFHHYTVWIPTHWHLRCTTKRHFERTNFIFQIYHKINWHCFSPRFLEILVVLFLEEMLSSW